MICLLFFEVICIYVQCKLCKDNIEVIENVKFKRFYGFHGDEQELFNKVQSNFSITLKKLSDKLLTEGYEVFESNKDTIVQFIHDHNLKSCGWITIDNPKYSSINESYCDISYKVSEKKIKSANSDYDLKMAPFRVCAYDIETISSDDGFPQARRKDDKIVSIACTFNEINKECDTRVVLIVHNEKFKIDKEHKVIICKDEEELINEWMQLIIDEDPDIITSWNGFGFDDNYIHERIMRLSGVIKYDEDINKNVYVDDKIKLDKKSKNDLICTLLSKENTYKINELFPVYLSRFAHPTNFVIKNLASAALGDSTMRYYDIKGRCVFDLMKVVRRDYKLVSYKLDYVASYMFRDKICKCEYDGNKTIITVDTKDLHNNQYIIIIRNDGASDYECFDEKKFQINIIQKISIIYANILIIMFNLLPIYPLDGARILNSIIKLLCGNKKANKYIYQISNFSVILLTMISSIAIFYLKNISILFILIYLWYLTYSENKKNKIKEKIYESIS